MSIVLRVAGFFVAFCLIQRECPGLGQKLTSTGCLKEAESLPIAGIL
jgi:hypothetical protein